MADRLLRGAALVSGALLAALVLLTVADVALRYFFSAPLTGALELTELAMLTLVMLALPWCAASDGHVRIDVLDRTLGARGRAVGDWLTDLVALGVLALLAWNTAGKSADAFEFDDRVNTLLVPLWPFYALIAVSVSTYALVVARGLVRRLLR